MNPQFPVGHCYNLSMAYVPIGYTLQRTRNIFEENPDDLCMKVLARQSPSLVRCIGEKFFCQHRDCHPGGRNSQGYTGKEMKKHGIEMGFLVQLPDGEIRSANKPFAPCGCIQVQAPSTHTYPHRTDLNADAEHPVSAKNKTGRETGRKKKRRRKAGADDDDD